MRAAHYRVALLTGLALVVLSVTWWTASAQVDVGGGGPSIQHQTSSRPLAPIVAHGSWPVYHRDNARSGNDPTLPPVISVTTGWTTASMDGQVYASPVIHGGIVYSATLNNTVYGFNQTDGTQVWTPNHLRNPEARANDPSGVNGPVCGNVTPQGILSTPAIDPLTGRIYVATLSGADDHYRVEGLNLLTGVSEFTFDITAYITSTGDSIDWKIQQQRGALAVANGYVYVPFGGRAGDCFHGSTPYYGWVVAVPIDGVSSTALYKTPSGAESVWSGGGVVVDDSTHNVFFATGNAIPCSGSTYSDAIVRVSPNLSSPSFFEPPDWQANWCSPDSDLGSAAPVLISPSLMFTAGKRGGGFLLDPTNLGGVNGQLFPNPAAYTQAEVCLGNHGGATFGSFAYSSPFIYAECDSRGLVALKLDTSVPSAPTFSPCGNPCLAPSWHVGGGTISGGGTTYGPPIVAAGAVWVASNSGLTAYNASTGALIYQSSSFGINRFVTPAEAGGQVFVPSHLVIRQFLMHFGASQSSPAPTPPARPTPIQQAAAPTPTSRQPVNQSSPAPSPPSR